MSNAMQRSKGVAAVALVVVTAFLAFASTGAAATTSPTRDPIATGTFDLHMKKGFLRKLGNLGVNVRAIGVGSLTGNKISFPVDGGALDPTDAKGFVESRGGFKLELGKRGVPLTRLTVNTATLNVFGVVARAHMQIGTLIPYTSAREGFGANFKSIKLALTPNAVQRISNRLGLEGSKRLNPGRVLSNAYSAVQPETVEVLPKGSATLVGDTTTLGKFAQKGVKLPEGITAIAPATHPTPVSFEFPISGGTIAPDASKGVVETTGGVQIVKDTETLDPTVKLQNVYVDLTAKTATVELEILPNPPFPGAVGRSSIVDVSLPPNSVAADPVTRTITVKGAEAKLQTVAASTLNDVFNQPPPAPPSSSNFVVGDPLGTFSMTVQAR